MKCDNNLIKADIQNETVEETLSHLQTQLSLLEHQNTEIRLKLDEEVFEYNLFLNVCMDHSDVDVTWLVLRFPKKLMTGLIN